MDTISREHELIKTGPSSFKVQHLTGLYRNNGEIIVRNGQEVGRLADTPANLIEAQWMAIKNDSPRVYEASRKMLQENVGVTGYETRLIEAARLITKGQVPEVSRQTLIGYHCICNDYQDGRDARFNDIQDAAPTIDGQTCCKCVLAVIILNRLNSQPQTVAQQRDQTRAQLGSIMGYQGQDVRHTPLQGHYYGR